MHEVLKKLGEYGIVPVVKLDDAEHAIPLGEALVKGGLPVAEITFRTKAAQQAIKNLTSGMPDMLVGAGTVLSEDQVKSAVDAGAKFIVSPGFNPKVVEYCVANNIPVTPGCSNPSDIEKALGYGLEIVKFFPAEAFGGLATLKAISAPYGMIRFIPTGGINAQNLNDYLSFSKVLACGGSWMVKDELIKKGDFDEITRLTREAVSIMLGFELAHVGINAENAEKSLGIAKWFAEVFRMPLKEGNNSNFAGTGIEVNKSTGRGKNGHIAIKTNNINRAIAYLGRNGVEVDMASAVKGDTEGSITSIYLNEEIGGFAVHLLQKK